MKAKDDHIQYDMMTVEKRTLEVETSGGETIEIDIFCSRTLGTTYHEDLGHWMIMEIDRAKIVSGKLLAFHEQNDAMQFIWMVEDLLEPYIGEDKEHIEPPMQVQALFFGAAVINHVCGWRNYAEQGFARTETQSAQEMH